MWCHGNSAFLLHWWSHSHTLPLDSGLCNEGLGSISKVFCLLHAVEELTSNFSLFVPSSIFLPGVCSGVGVLSQLWDKHFSSHRKRSTLNDIPLSPPPQAVLNRIRIQLVASLQPIFILYGFARCKRMLANSLSESNSSEAGVPNADAFGQYSSSHPRNAC